MIGIESILYVYAQNLKIHFIKKSVKYIKKILKCKKMYLNNS